MSANGALQLAQQLEHGRLHRHVEPGGRLVEDHQARVQRQDAREPDAALLPARKLVRVQIEVGPRQADLLQDLGDARVALGSASARCGSRAARPASGRSSSAGRASCPGPGRRTAARGHRATLGADWPVMSLPSNTIRPPLGGWIPTASCRAWTCRSPISPDDAERLARPTSNETPSSARTAPVVQPERCAPGSAAASVSTCEDRRVAHAGRRLRRIADDSSAPRARRQAARRRTLGRDSASVARAQRGWKRQPAGGVIRLGISPPISLDLARRARQALEQARGVGMVRPAGRKRRPAPSPPPGPRT